MAKLLVLGGGGCQLNAVIRAKQKKHTVIVSDYYPDAPGKALADFAELTSTFDWEGNLETARKYGVDGVMTIGTDQPVLTAARVCEVLKLPTMIDAVTAKAVTNKKVMKELFNRHDIPTVNHRILSEDFSDRDAEGLKAPYVVKPLDSQGQRGVLKLESLNDVRRSFKDVLSYSRENEILIEEYYESDEITLSGWVRDGKACILTITDRNTYNNYPHIGICTSHNFPSKHMKKYYENFKDITDKIVSSFNIKNGPIYFQMLVGKEGVKVNEVACRIGGAYEDELIPLLTGVDILNMQIDMSLGIRADLSPLERYDIRKNKKHAVVQMIFTRPGLIKSMADMDKIRKLPGVVYGRYNFKPGEVVNKIENATQRVGYMIVQGSDRLNLIENLKGAMSNLNIRGQDGSNLLIDFYQNENSL
ncbi:MAG: carboxylate--amine ligase [Clostridiales bacterium]|nr:carboxylate--amine ligase [Clostridiales bacterium]